MAVSTAEVIDLAGLQNLLDVLADDGFTVLGPTVRSGAVVPGRVRSVDDLPRGVGDAQEAGTYRLRQRDDQALFGFAADAISWKSVLFPSRELIWRAEHTPTGVEYQEAEQPGGGLGEPPYAILGIRSCDLHAVAIHDRVLRDRAYPDTRYQARRAAAFLITVVCSDPSGTCFCVSMKTGPRADSGYDLALTELLDGGHRFVVDAGSERGADVLARLSSGVASGDDIQASQAVVEDSSNRMGRIMLTDGIRDLLYDNAEHPRWQDAANRCLSCGNCTSVCPTCFCTSVEDTTSLTGNESERWRVWDSCFTTDFSHLHGGSVRATPVSRYRQWMTHKLASWQDQFGSSGCVGCGRCIAWCPVGIDITEEVAAIQATPAASPLPPAETPARRDEV